MKTKRNVSVGISAYNEENTIKEVLEGILAQQQEGWKLTEIRLYCDGCTDETAAIARSVKNKRITVIDDKKRKGKTSRLNELFRAFKGDILVMFDGDIELMNHEVITNLIAPFAQKLVMLVGGNSSPFPPKTFVEKAVNTTFEIFYASRKEVRGGNNIFGCTGSIWAVRRSFAKMNPFPKIISEDAYLYLLCIKQGFQFRYVDTAKVYYQLPKTFRDYLKQIIRSNPGAVDSELHAYFGDLATRELTRPSSFYISQVFRQFLKNPLGTGIIVFMNAIVLPLNSFIWKIYRLDWFTAPTTHS
ncbi:MAG TPA: glycosyltransferase [Patescibacteria group bacterium]|nr:glycosyltransferase [Patescibacteria group bacterium]